MSAGSTKTTKTIRAPDLPVGLGEPDTPVRRRRDWRRSWVLAALCALAVVAASVAISRSAVFSMRSLTVRGNVHLTSRQVSDLAGLTSRTNVVWLSVTGIERRLLADPWVRSAEISRSLPSSVTVVIHERLPAAIASRGRGTPAFLLAADGVVLAPASAADVAMLPSIQIPLGERLGVGDRLPASNPAVRVVAGFAPGLAAEIRTVSLGPSGVQLVTRGGVKVIYGDASEPEAKARALAAVLTWARNHRVHPVYIDVSVPSAPALLPVNAVVFRVWLMVEELRDPLRDPTDRSRCECPCGWDRSRRAPF